MKLLLISKFFNFVNSAYSFFIINLRFKFSKKKTVFFYFPRKSLTLKDINYIKDLMKKLNQKYLVLYGHKMDNINLKNFYFLNDNFLKYFQNLNLFISNYICDFFPKNTKKIYIHHSLYDTPLTGKKSEKQTIKRLEKYNFIFLSSKKMVRSFINIFKIKNKKIQIISTGYPRLDFFDKLNKIQKKSIIIAPANFLAYPNDTMLYDSEKIIEKVKKLTNLKIVFRPHPINRIFFKENFENIYVNRLISKYSNDKRVTFDFSEDYSKSYSDSTLMITDISATAFTYSFLTFNPVLFYSPKESLFKRDYKKLHHFKDRKKIGIVVYNIKNFSNLFKKLLVHRKKYIFSIKSVRSQIDYIGKSKTKTIKSIVEILDGKYDKFL